MINLLPPDKKRQIKAGKSNVLILRYCILSVMLAALLFALVGGVYMMMEKSRQSAEGAIQESRNRSAEYQKAQKEVDDFRANLLTAKTILDKEVRYSEIAVKIAQALPQGVILQSLQLDSKTFGQPITLNALGKSYDDALRLKSALEQSSYFENVHLLSISSRNDDQGYPVTIAISVTINPEIIKS